MPLPPELPEVRDVPFAYDPSDLPSGTDDIFTSATALEPSLEQGLGLDHLDPSRALPSASAPPPPPKTPPPTPASTEIGRAPSVRGSMRTRRETPRAVIVRSRASRPAAHEAPEESAEKTLVGPPPKPPEGHILLDDSDIDDASPLPEEPTLIGPPPKPPEDTATRRTRALNRSDATDPEIPAHRGLLQRLDAQQNDAETFVLQDERTLIGRLHGDIVLRDDPHVAPCHAQLIVRPGRPAQLTDLGARNGVFVRLTAPHTLVDGDVFVLGRQVFAYRTTWAAQASAASPLALFDGDADTEALGSDAEDPVARLLHVRRGGGLLGVYPLADKAGHSATLGRERGDVLFPNAAQMSTAHAMIRAQDGAHSLIDLDSTTGVYLRVRGAVELGNDACFQLGMTRLRLRIA